MRATGDRASLVFKLIAASHDELSSLYAALADLDRDSGSGTGEGSTAERPVTITDIGACIDAGNAARKACLEGGGVYETCYAVGRIAEAACLDSILKAPKEVKDK
jgi:hypothetical protein